MVEPHAISVGRDQDASLVQVMEVARMLDAYNEYLQMTLSAEDSFASGNVRAGANILRQMWYSPSIVPALMLYESFYARQLLMTNWRGPWCLHYALLEKSTGGKRQLVIPSKDTRLAMGVVNSFLQTTCFSWTSRTVGFRPGYGTEQALGLLQGQAANTLSMYGTAHIMSFDIKAAFNSVNINALFNKLGLSNLPRPIKALIWEWHNPKVPNLVPSWSGPTPLRGLPQGFSYSPTLFSYYLDNILVKDSSWIAYADNFAGVFKSHREAHIAFNDAQATLARHGFSINHDTLLSVSFSAGGMRVYKGGTHAQGDALTRRSHFAWLGHALDLSNSEILLLKYAQPCPVVVPVVKTIDQWAADLHSHHWAQQAYGSGWRKI